MDKLVISSNPRSGQLYNKLRGLDKGNGIKSVSIKSPNYANRNMDKNILLNKWKYVDGYLSKKNIHARPKFKAGIDTAIDNPPKIGHNPVSMKPLRVMQNAKVTKVVKLLSRDTIRQLSDNQYINIEDDEMFGYLLDASDANTFLSNIRMVVDCTHDYIMENAALDTQNYFKGFTNSMNAILNGNIASDDKLKILHDAIPDMFMDLYNEALKISECESKNILKDFGELIVYIYMLSKRREAYLPVSGNYPLSDIIVINRTKGGTALTIDAISIKSQRDKSQQPGSSAYEFLKHLASIYPKHSDIFQSLRSLHVNSIYNVNMDDIKDQSIKNDVLLIHTIDKIKTFNSAKKICSQVGVDWNATKKALDRQYEKYKNEIPYNPYSMSIVLKELVFRRYAFRKTLNVLAQMNLDTKLKFAEVVAKRKEVYINEKDDTITTSNFCAHDKGYLSRGNISGNNPRVENLKYLNANMALRYVCKK